MSEAALAVRVEPGPEGRLEVRSPAVGVWTHELRPGAVVGAGTAIGRLRRLGRSTRLVLPPVVPGRATGSLLEERSVPVDYGQLLFEIAPAGGAWADAAAGSPGRGAPASAEGAVPVLAPTDGVFYRAPSAGGTPFVEVGRRVREGDPVGLIEVMKTFSHVLYGGPGLPAEAEVVEVCCADAEEVRAGRVLMLVRASAPGT